MGLLSFSKLFLIIAWFRAQGLWWRLCRIVISSEREKSFSFAVRQRGEGSGKHCPPCDWGGRCFMQTALRRESETGNEKDPSAALGMTKRGNVSSHFFSFPLRKPTSVPSGHLLPEEGGRMPPHRLPMKKAYDTRIPLPHIRHFERKREIFFVCGQAKNVRGADSGKHRAPSKSEGWCFMQTALRRKTEEGNEKDPSAALGMTKRRKTSSHFFSSRYESQPPPRRGE